MSVIQAESAFSTKTWNFHYLCIDNYTFTGYINYLLLLLIYIKDNVSVATPTSFKKKRIGKEISCMKTEMDF